MLNDGRPIRADELRPWLRERGKDQLDSTDASLENQDLLVGMKLDDVERRLIETTLARFEGHRAKTAAALGIGIRTLSGKLRSYGYAPREKDFAKAG